MRKPESVLSVFIEAYSPGGFQDQGQLPLAGYDASDYISR